MSQAVSQYQENSFLPVQWEDWESLGRFASAITIAPLTSVACFFFPFCGATVSGYRYLRTGDPSQTNILKPEDSLAIAQEIDELKKVAKIKRSVSIYLGEINKVNSYGGRFSITDPLIAIPHEWIIRSDGTILGSNSSSYENNYNYFSDNETRFFLAREIVRIKRNHALIPLVTRILLLVAAILFFASSFPFWIGIAIAISAVALNLFTERDCQGKMDLAAVRILAEKLGNFTDAKEIALSALKKIQNKNISRLNNRITRLYMTKGGDNFLNVLEPCITTRIQNVQKMKEG